MIGAVSGPAAVTTSRRPIPLPEGVEGPLVFYSDPSCTGRPVADTFCVDRASVSDAVGWKMGFSRFAPGPFDALVAGVVEHLNRRRTRLYVSDLFCGWDPSFAEPYRFVGEYATHAYFCNIMFPRPPLRAGVGADLNRYETGWTLLNIPPYILLNGYGPVGQSDRAVNPITKWYIARLAGTEVGVTEPEATFSSCFGAPFMALRPHVYAELLRDRIRQHRSRCVLLNTGWTGGPCGKGERMSLAVTRTLLDTALGGGFDYVDTEIHPLLELKMPTSCPAVDDIILNPRHTWDDPIAYDEAATRLRDMFRANYDRQGYASLGVAAMM